MNYRVQSMDLPLAPQPHFHHQLPLLVFYLEDGGAPPTPPSLHLLLLVLVVAARKIFAVIGTENAIAFRPTTQKAKIQMHSTTTSRRRRRRRSRRR